MRFCAMDRDRHMNTIKRRRCMALMMAAVLILCALLTGCGGNEAEEAVKADLDSMRDIEFDAAGTEELLSMLSQTGRDNFYEFRDKAGTYEYTIEGSSENDNGTASVVTVQVKTYSFGRIYLETWTDAIEKAGGKTPDQADFYELLMKNLSEAKEKTFFKNVEITCADTDGDGNLNTDAASNADLRDAIFGGMLTEIAHLAE